MTTLMWPLFSVVVTLFACTVCEEFDYTINIEPGKIQCYFQPIENEKHVQMEFDYQVIDGGDLNVNFFITSPNGAVLAQDHMKMDGTHKIETRLKGDYQFCFDNSFSYQASKMVFFELFLMDEKGSYDDNIFPDGVPKVADLELVGISLDSFMVKAQRVRDNLNQAEHLQSKLRAYEARDRAVMEANFARVNTWSFVNAFVMILVGTLQVYMIRSMFDEHSRVGRLMRGRKL